TEHLGAYLGFPTISRPEGVFIPWEATKEGAFIVDAAGHRFADAGAHAYSEFAERIVDHDADAVFLIFDGPVDEAMASQPSTADRWANCREHGVFVSAETPTDLAQALGIDPNGLESTIESLQAVGEPGDTAPDGVTRQFARALEPPFFGTEISPAVLQTQGGLVVDEGARVLDADGEPIPGLFAGGGAAVGLSGSRPSGYLSGNGLLSALNLGRIAGRAAADWATQGNKEY
ncbi:MAG: FAD-binding protein, partial [Salinirussus sp.]